MPEDVETGRLSTVLRNVLATGADGVTVGEIADRVAGRGFGLLLALLGLPTLIPILPPGASAVVGLLCVLIGVQLLAGSPMPWLPSRIRRKRLSPQSLEMLANRGVDLFVRLETLSRPRLRFIMLPLPLRVVALVLVAIGIVLVLPIPFMNTVPGVGILLLGFGLLNRDGVFVIIGTLLCLALVILVAFFGHLLSDLLNWVTATLRG